MLRAMALAQTRPDLAIVVLGTREESNYMANVAVEGGFPPSKLIVDGNSKTTIDNAYFAKRISLQNKLKGGIIVTSQYQMPRALTTFEWIFGPDYFFKLSASESETGLIRRIRETAFRILVPLFALFRKGDDQRLKKASDKMWLLFHGSSFGRETCLGKHCAGLTHCNLSFSES